MCSIPYRYAGLRQEARKANMAEDGETSGL